MQALWRTSSSDLQDRRSDAHLGRSCKIQVSDIGSLPAIQTMPRGVRKRIIGEIKKQIHLLENHHEVSENGARPEHEMPCTPTDDELHEIFQLIRIGEVFSNPRFTQRAPKHGLFGGRAFDLQLGDDLLVPSNRKACLQHLRTENYDFVAVSPPCEMFSMLQFLAKGRSKEQLQHDDHYQKKFQEAMTLLTFGITVCLDQQIRGKLYMFEHPWSAMSWRQNVIQRVLRLPSTYVARTDQCCFGLTDLDHNPIRKRTGIMSNSRHVARAVARTCKEDHVHQHCIGASHGKPRAAAAARYTNKMVDAILRGVIKELRGEAINHDRSLEEFEMIFHSNHSSWSKAPTISQFVITSNGNDSAIPQVHLLERCTTNQFDLLPVEAALEPSASDEIEHLAPEDEDVEQISEERRTKIMKELEAIHRGLGHPCLQHMLKILKAGNASKAVCQIARDFTCATCLESSRPKPWRLAAPPRELPFNEVVGVDLITLKLRDISVHCLNIICWGTRYQMVIPLTGTKSQDVRNAYRHWTTCFGAPRVVKCDLGREFKKDFSARCATDGTILDPISLEAPTQNSITEREGKSFKMIFYKTAHEYGNIESQDEMHELIHVTGLMKNRLSHRGGYSPIHRVFGITPCLPGETLRGDEGNHAHTAALQAGDIALQKQEHMRLAAGRAFFSQSCTDAIRRAKYSGSRRIDHFEVGDVVYFWAINQHMKVGHQNSASRRPPQQCWNGPATVVAYQHPNSLYLNHQGRLVKAAPEQCRHNSADEEASTSALLEKLCRIRQNFQEDRVIGIEDITAQDRPEHVEDHPTHKKRAYGKQPPAEKRLRVAAAAVDDEPNRDTMHRPAIDLDPSDEEQYERNVMDLDSNIGSDVEIASASDGYSASIAPSSDHSLWNLEHLGEQIEAWSAKTQSKELQLKDLDDHDKQLFRAAIKKEWDTNVKAGAIRVVPPSEALRIRQTMPHRIMKSRLLHVAKPIDDITQFDSSQILHHGSEEQPCKAKSRWIVRGDRDPDLFSVESTSPVVARDSLFLGLQVISSHQWPLHFADFSQAFMQGGEISRKEPLYCEIPCDQIDGIEPGSLVVVLKTVYGLTDAPYQWNQHLDHALRSLGYKPSILDACLYMLHKDDSLQGVIMLATDDLISGGTQEHWSRMNQLKEKYRFGKWDFDKGRFCGKDISRQKDGVIKISQEYYADLKCQSRIKVPKGVSDDQPCTAEQVKELRSYVGALSWLSKETRVDLAGSTAILMQCFPKPCIRDLKTCNKILKDAFKHKDVHIKLQPIDPTRLSILVTSDAAWGNALDEKGDMEKSQAGYIVMACDRMMLHGQESHFGILGWKSHTLKRRTVSTLGAETQAIVESSSVASWFRYLLVEMMFPQVLPKMDSNWEDSLKVLEFGLVTDAKSVFDALSRPSPISAADKRTCIDLSIIRDFLRRDHGCIRWIDGRYQLADSLTKMMPSDFLRAVLKLGRYQLTDEYDALQLRRDAKLEKQARRDLKIQTSEKESMMDVKTA